MFGVSIGMVWGSVFRRCPELFADYVKLYLRHSRLIDIHRRPKDHGMMELARSILVVGSPQVTGCWRDESENQILKKLGPGAHRAN
eukprot:8882978-Alexandrium_andersonii.AAC.2